ncbi:choice-of-anchor G family protein, partial [Microbacterium barkeri]|uniref:choice-of-anchor G family protein n=3 Tax=Microbacteriaceae TaxID=85023 RepID=UPI003F1604EA
MDNSTAGARAPRKRRLAPIATLAAASLVAGGVAYAANVNTTGAANADTITTEADSAAHGHLIWAEGLGLDVAGAGSSFSQLSAEGPREERSPLDLEVLGLVNLGLGVDLPLVKPDASSPGLLELGAIGVAESYSSSPTLDRSIAASGLLGENGALDLSAYDSVGQPASLDLTALLSQVISEELTDTVLSEAGITIGAVGSQIEKNGTDVTSLYRIADLQLNLTSPVLADTTTLVDNVLDPVLAPVNALVGEGGAISTLVTSLVSALDAINVLGLGGIDASVAELGLDTTALTNSLQTELLAAPLDNSTATEPASVSIDLSNGSISVDLGALLLQAGGYTDLNELPANTSVLTDEVVNAVVGGVTDALTGTGPNSLTTKLTNLISDGIYGVGVNLDLNLAVSLLGIPATNTTVSLQGDGGGQATLGGVLGVEGYAPASLEIADEGILGGLLGLVTPLLDPVVGQLGGILQPVIDTLVTNLSTTVNGVVNPIVTNLMDNALEPVLSQVAELTINEQPAEGDLGAGSSTVRALSVNLLPILGDASVTLELGSSSVRALDVVVYDTSITAEPGSVEAGETVTITGAGFAPNETVTITIDGVVVGTATTDADGDGFAEFTFDYTVPADAEPQAGVVVVAEGDVSQTPAQDTFDIVEGNAEVDATADTSAAADADVNASASASASANADDNSNASAQVAAQAAALADATTDASAAADATAAAAAQAAATADASSDASTTADSDVTAAAQAAAQSSAEADSQADATAAANADASSAA